MLYNIIYGGAMSKQLQKMKVNPQKNDSFFKKIFSKCAGDIFK